MKEKVLLLLVPLLLLSMIPVFDLLNPGLPITHDGQDHVARIANFYQNLKEGVIIPRWAANLNWGYGHPILMFLYPFSSYATSLIHVLGFSFVDSFKIFFGLSYIASGFAMYLWIQSFFEKKTGLIAALLYLFAPYRMIDIYVRGAIGEHAAFIFPPLILYSLLKLSSFPKFSYIALGATSLAGLILAHNAISLMFLPVIGVYALYLLFPLKEKKAFLKSVVLVFAFGFSLSAFFWIPAFFEGKYTLRDIVTKNDYVTNFVSVQSFLYGNWSYGGSGMLSTQVGITQWMLILLSIPALINARKKKERIWIFTTVLFIIFFITLWLMTDYSSLVWRYVPLLQKFQFPWRFLSLSVFIASFSGAFVFYKASQKAKNAFLIITLLLLLFLNKDYWHAQGYQKKPETFYSSVYNGTTDTGESAPIWSVRFMLARPKKEAEVIEGNAAIKKISRKTTSHVYEIVADRETRILENTLFFPGWQVFIDGKENKNIQFQDPAYRGLITFFVPKGNHTVDIRFTETKLRILADLISGAGILILVFYFPFILLWQRFRWF